MSEGKNTSPLVSSRRYFLAWVNFYEKYRHEADKQPLWIIAAGAQFLRVLQTREDLATLLSAEKRSGLERSLLRELYDYLEQLLVVYRARGYDTSRDGPFSALLGFKGPLRFARAVGTLLEYDALSEEEERLSRALAADILTNAEYERGAMNRALGYACAIRPLLEICETHPLENRLMELDASLYGDWLRCLEPHENAFGYDGLTYRYLMDWLEQSGREGVFGEPAVRNGLENVLFRMSPIGITPAFGDWRPTEREFGFTLAILEKAASVYSDSSFKWGADRVFAAYKKLTDQGWHDGTGSSHDLWGLAQAIEWSDDTLDAVNPDGRSRIIYRNDGSPSKAILSSGTDSDDMFALFSLHNGNEHSHNDPLALLGLTAHGEVLIEDNGRNTREREFHNSLTVRKRVDELPFPRNFSMPGEWQTARFDLSKNWIWGHFKDDRSVPVPSTHPVFNDIPSRFDYDPESQFVLVFGINHHGHDISFDVADASLKGPAGRLEIDLSDAVTVRDDVKLHVGKIVGQPLKTDGSDYTFLEFTFRVRGREAHDYLKESFACIGDYDGYPKKWVFANNPQCNVAVVDFADSASRTAATFRLAEVTSEGVSVTTTRSLTFLKNRLLYIRDELEIDSDEPAYGCASWHLQDVTVEDDVLALSGVNGHITLIRFCEAGDGLALFSTDGVEASGWQRGRVAPGSTSSSPAGKKRERHNPNTHFRIKRLAKGEPAVFETWIVPHGGKERAIAEVASFCASSAEDRAPCS